MNDDATLLRRYADTGSEGAFAELVQRHVDLVYGSALRRTGDTHRAADVAQDVFTKLARQAGQLVNHTALSAWLHTATRNAALNLMISDQRRRSREAEAVALSAAHATDAAPDWSRLSVVLDAAIDELAEPDRAAVVLRFLERRTYAEIGRALGVSEDAARMRADRALEKLRALLARRGIRSTSAALATVVAAETAVAAPVGLAATLVSQSLMAAAAASPALALFSLMTTKLIVTAAATALVAFVAGTRFASTPPAAPAAIVSDSAAHSQVVSSLRDENRRLSTERESLSTDLAQLRARHAALEAESAKRTAASAPAQPKQGATLGLARWEIEQATLVNLRQIDAARKQYQLERNRLAGSVHDLVGRKSYIKALRTVDGEDYSGISMNPADPITVTSPSGVTVTFDPSGATTTQPEIPAEVARVMQLAPRIEPLIHQAVNAYRAAKGGNPPNDQALLPYFATPKDGADFVEYREAMKAAGR